MLSIPINDSGFHLGTPISEQYTAIIPPASFSLILIQLLFLERLVSFIGWWSALFGVLILAQARPANRVIGNVLIAIGALSVASASELTHLGYGQFIYVGELIAAILMFLDS